MIYLFENPDGRASIVYDGSTLTNAQKAQAVAVEQLPVADTPTGKIAVLKVSKTENRVWYDYEDAPINEIEQLKVENEQLKNSLADLWEVVLLGGAE